MTHKSQSGAGVYGVPTELPVSLYAGTPKSVLTLAKECLSYGVDDCVSKSEGEQAKAKASFFRIFLCGLESVAQI